MGLFLSGNREISMMMMMLLLQMMYMALVLYTPCLALSVGKSTVVNATTFLLPPPDTRGGVDAVKSYSTSVCKQDNSTIFVYN